MENQKLIWIILSVTVAAIIVLLGGLILLKDETLTIQTDDRSGMNTPMSRINAESYAFDYTRENYPLTGLEPTLEENDVISSDVVIGEADEQEKEEAVRVKEEDTKESATKPKDTTPKTTAKTTSSGIATSPAKSRTVLAKEYWIQAGSYIDRHKADDLNDFLMEKGLPGRISTKSVNGKTFYRVRIGPYTIKKEAEKFLIWVKALNGLETSYISEVSVKRKVN
ncbi:MAG: SPOR domain-containing protein [Spirochaetales bacterium]|nr:SPOR domain-containing protein [Spirochaetales bacterium]